MEKIIGFWKPQEKYGFLSQWYKCTFTDDEGREYNCAEQYMMAQKALLFKDEDILLDIMYENNPSNIKKYGRRIKNFNSDVWDANKYNIVHKGNELKFTQNPRLLKKLVSTGDAILVEASPYDNIWGIGTTNYSDKNKWCGENLLGKILMEVRDNGNK